ncbi:hypothetical protein GCM10022223_28000 [Kineosporia mesophila]|uniref:Uncharacterized protein n=1 Tax=Kineosporia mesophila TaxID=566012 RepID=A0ABP6ZLT3_9ACTN|nr:hypothetical protein [Kineosporia mesophila]MCD5353467.1 hypothetical protein [Kineosporia mesophila]
MNGDPFLSAEALVSHSPGGRINRILWFHRTDRWYFGDFLRHSAWLAWARESFPAAVIDLASHAAYLPLFADDRFGRHFDSRPGEPAGPYDLVIEPGSFEPAPAPGLRLASWDSGWALRHNGRVLLEGRKEELNYFRAAHPGSVTGHRCVAPTRIRFSPAELAHANSLVERAFPGQAPVVVYNPSASNAFTRETGARKEVDNSLTAHEHATVLRQTLKLMPDHRFIVGASVKIGDRQNESLINTLARTIRSDRVRPITSLGGGLTLRGFAGLLAASRVHGMLGTGTGTNTHLAALLGLRALSVERGHDEDLQANWSGPGFQMGSFRWRNPALDTEIHTVDRSRGDEDELLAVAGVFALGEMPAEPLPVFDKQWDCDPAAAVRSAAELLGAMPPQAAAHYGDFTDEAAYLGSKANGLKAVVAALESPDPPIARMLFEDSNLFKLVTRPGRSM